MKTNERLTGVQFVIPGCEARNPDTRLTSSKPQRNVNALALFAGPAANSYATDGRCHNAEPGTYGHECGKPASWHGTKASGFTAGFCDDCKTHGHDARGVVTWARLSLTAHMREDRAAILPNGLFEVWSPDQVAECLDGIGDLYERLWAVVAEYDGKPRSEVNDDFGERCLAKYWDRFSDDDKRALNAAAEAHDAEMAKYRR